MFTIENRFLPPILITGILLAAHLSFGVLESYQRTALAIATAIGAELVMGRLTCGLAEPGERLHHRHQRRHPDSIAVLLAVFPDQPDFDRLEIRPAPQGRHLWNPRTSASAPCCSSRRPPCRC
jgi:hypothetical protein